MSLTEIKQQVGGLTTEERSELTGYLKLLALENDPDRAKRLAQRMAMMDDGRKVDEAGLMQRMPGLREKSV